jgi:hypothetical protein
VRIPPFFLLLALSCAILVGCGVRFRDPEPGNEFFKSATVSGDLHAGSTITGAVTIAQRYNIDVPIACELRQGKELVKPIGTETIPALVGGTPKSTPVAAQYSYDFSIEAAGAYKFECYTTKDQDNFIIREFSVR